MSNFETDEALFQSLSAVADGEATELELARVLASCDKVETRATWERMHLVSAVMRRELPNGVTRLDIASGVRAALEAEDAPSQAPRRWLANAGRFAIAASVAAVVVVGTQWLGRGDSNELVADAPAELPPYQLPTPQVAVPTAQAASLHTGPLPQLDYTQERVAPQSRALSPEEQRYLNELLLLHAENAALHNSRGMMPYARITEKHQ